MTLGEWLDTYVEEAELDTDHIFEIEGDQATN